MFSVKSVHNDWYSEGPEGDREALWRLDFFHGDDAFQAQLFCKIPDGVDEDEWCEAKRSDFQSARLFIERDNRLPSGARWDYACHAWPLSAQRAMTLLHADTEKAVKNMRTEIVHVASLSNDRAFIRKYSLRHEKEREEVEKYWAELDSGQ